MMPNRLLIEQDRKKNSPTPFCRSNRWRRFCFVQSLTCCLFGAVQYLICCVFADDDYIICTSSVCLRVVVDILSILIFSRPLSLNDIGQFYATNQPITCIVVVLIVDRPGVMYVCMYVQNVSRPSGLVVTSFVRKPTTILVKA